MSREKQIEDIRKVIANCDDVLDIVCCAKPCSLCKAEDIYNAGYRKQSEGEWRPYKTPLDARQTGWICSNCSSVIYDLSNGDTDFCPNCGARMSGGNKDE